MNSTNAIHIDSLYSQLNLLKTKSTTEIDLRKGDIKEIRENLLDNRIGGFEKLSIRDQVE